jgi:hypothetical protein
VVALSFVYDSPIGSSIGQAAVDFSRSVVDFSITKGVSGYFQAEFTLTVTPREADLWVSLGLYRDIKVFADTYPLWRGYVIDVVSGGEFIEKSQSAEDLANRVIVRFTNSITKVAEETTAGNNNPSQFRYGIRQLAFSGGELTSANADDIRDSILKARGFPTVIKSLSGSTEDTRSIKISCATYEKRLEYEYTNTTISTITRKQKIKNVLSSEPNGLITASYGGIEADSMSVESAEEGRSGLDIIRDLANLGGDSDDDRRVFWLNHNLSFALQRIPTTVDFVQRDRRIGSFARMSSGIVKPFLVQPGRWIIFPEVLSSLGAGAHLRSNPGAGFIESVTYTPGEAGNLVIDITMGSTSTLKQQLAKFGLGGF